MAIHDVELLRREMMAAGNRLILALAAESEFGRMNPGADGDAIRKQWHECRCTVAQLADDYADAISLWRTAVVAMGRTSQEDDSIQAIPPGDLSSATP